MTKITAGDVISDMEDDVRTLIDLVRAVRFMAEQGGVVGIDSEHCKSIARVADCAFQTAADIEAGWERAFELTR